MPWVESYSNLSTIGGDSNEEHAPVTADGHPSYPPVDYNQGYQDQNADQYYGTNQQWGYQSYQDTSKPTEGKPYSSCPLPHPAVTLDAQNKIVILTYILAV